MKYWLLTTEYPPFFGGGIGTYCAITAKMLSDNGHDISVFVADASIRDIQSEQKDGVRIIRFNTSRTGSSAFLGHVTNISYEFADILKYFIEKEGKPDVIEAQEYLGIAYYLLQYKFLLFDWCRDIPVMITMHSPSFLYMEYNHIPQYRYPNYWICEMERFCLQAADQVVSPSRYMSQELKKRFHLNHSKVDIIPNPFEMPGNQSGQVPHNTDTSQIVFYGKLTAQKGAFRLMNYFDQLWRNGFSRPLYLIGGQDIVYHPEGITMGDWIRKKYRKYIDQGLLRMEDKIKPVDRAIRLSAAEVVIVPSDNDNLPYVVFEMMALGRIVLVSKQGGHTEIVENGVDGFIFDHHEPQTFFDQLQLILKLSPEEKNVITARAINKVAEHFSPGVIYKQKIKLLEKLVQQQQSRTIFPFVRSRLMRQQAVTIACRKGHLSIVVPYYNMGRYIDETIVSLRRVTYKDKEIIIINDGSSDIDSLDKLNAYRREKDIKIMDVPNGGLATARNLGASVAEGEFLAFLDADDTVQPDYFEKAISVFNQYGNVHFAGCWIQYFGNSENIWPAFSPEPPLILYHNLINTSSLVYRKDAFLTAGVNDAHMVFQGLEDYESAISMTAAGFNGVVIPEPLFGYRIRPDSMIRAISRTKKLYLSEYISNKHKEFYATFAADVFNLLSANGPGILLDNPSLDHHLADRIPFGGKMAGGIIALVKKNRFAKTIAYKLYKLLKK